MPASDPATAPIIAMTLPVKISAVVYLLFWSFSANGLLISNTPTNEQVSCIMSHFVIFSFSIKKAKNVDHIGIVKKMQLLVETGMYFKEFILPYIPVNPTRPLNKRTLRYIGLTLRTCSP